MKIEQKKGKNHHTFTLENDYFNYEYKDSSNRGDVDLYYADLPVKTMENTELNEWLRNVGFLWVFISVAQSVYSSYSTGKLHLDLMWMVLGFACVAWAYLTKVTYTVYQSEKANVFIIKDKHHDSLIAELMKRRKAQLYAWYADINLENDLENELNKFDWLQKQEVLSPEEVRQKKEELKYYHENSAELTEARVLN